MCAVMHRRMSVSDRAELHLESEQPGGGCDAERGHTGVTVSEYSIHGKLGRDNFVINGVC